MFLRGFHLLFQSLDHSQRAKISSLKGKWLSLLLFLYLFVLACFKEIGPKLEIRMDPYLRESIGGHTYAT